MSLEKALQENTEALNKLIALMQAAGTATCAAPTAEEVKQKEPVKSKEVATATPAVEHTDPVATKLKYEDVQGPFLKLVNKDRAAAVAILGKFSCQNLKQATDAQYADILTAVEEALNG